MVTVRWQHGGQKSLEFGLREMRHQEGGVGGKRCPAGIGECGGEGILTDSHLFSEVFLEDGEIAFC